MRHQLIFLAAAALAVAGCGSNGSNYQPSPTKPVEAAALKPGDELKIFPLKVGNQWTYSGETTQRVANRTGSGKFELTFKVTKVTPKGDGVVADIQVTNNNPDAKADFQRWELNKKGLYQTAVGNPAVPFNPPQPIILFPADEGRKFSWKGTGITPANKQGSSNLNSEILPFQEVDGETERFSALCVSSKGTFKVGNANGQVASMAYWTPGVGLVRYRHEVALGNGVAVQVLKLKAKTVQ